MVGWWPSRAVTFLENHDTVSADAGSSQASLTHLPAIRAFEIYAACPVLPEPAFRQVKHLQCPGKLHLGCIPDKMALQMLSWLSQIWSILHALPANV